MVKIKISELPEFDAAHYLGSKEEISAYLTAVLEENDPELLAAALADIARACGVGSPVQEEERSCVIPHKSKQTSGNT